ncbi:MAG: hypothetical protein GXP39_15355 [Chloroflexi bacterium]|nr:hypothetical protein [Chloroflexota bacterium]
MALIEVHDRLANTVLLYLLAMTLWGWWRFLRRRGVDGSYWGALVIVELVLIVQGGLGGFLWLQGIRPARSIHVLYGVMSILALPTAYAYTRGRGERAEMLLYSVVTLILIGLVLRAMMTGG